MLKLCPGKAAALSHCVFLLMSVISLSSRALAMHSSHLYPVPNEVSSQHFVVSVNGQSTPVMHATVWYYLLNFEVSKTATISVTASDAHYWDAGVEIQPMRLGIRPHREGATITFAIPGPVKLSISRPDDHFGDSEMLFLFANAPEKTHINARTPGVHYYGPGVHRENINAHSGETVYLDPGAVVFGGLNLWQVHDVHVLGRGTIIYDGPQDPNHDEGWMHKPDWHVMVMDNARNIEIEGITGIARSRTWMVQMRDSRQITFRNVKIVGGSAGNANQDGFDWLGGGDTLIQDCFVRAADDIFAMYGNWDGYQKELMTVPGHEVSNIVIENSVLSTSISNIVRLSWPTKTFDSHNFTLRNSDVIHMGIGGCIVPFALFEIWDDPGGKGQHTGYHFENIRLEDWYSLLQLRHPNPAVRDVSLKDIWAMDEPGMVPSVLKGDVNGVTVEGLHLGTGSVERNDDLPLDVAEGASDPAYQTGPLDSRFGYTEGLIAPKQKVTFSALGADTKGVRYRWLFGDGSTAKGRQVRHTFPDAEGTLLDNSGRFRVLLHARDHSGHESWSSQSVVVASKLLPGADVPPVRNATAADKTYDQNIRVPADGGYTFTLLTSTNATFTVDGLPVIHSPKARPMVCGALGNAVQATRLSVALSKGWHHILTVLGDGVENAASVSGAPLVLWEGPGIARQAIPAETYADSIQKATGTSGNNY